MNNFKLIAAILFVLVCVFLSYSYRIRQYKIVPKVNATFDEMEYLWLGKSILTTGIPASWSVRYSFQDQQSSLNKADHVANLENYNITSDGIKPGIFSWRQFPKPITVDVEASIDGYKSQFQIAQPQLINPPLAGIIFALFDSGKTLYTSTIGNIRLVPIILLSLTTGVILTLGYYLSNFKAGAISALVYAVGPGFVISSRLAVPENLLAALFPLTLLILFFYLRSPKLHLFISLVMVSFLCPLLKISGIIIPITLAAALTYKTYYRKAVVIFVAMVAGFAVYLAYGLFFEPNLFLNILSVHSERDFLGPAGMLVKILYPEIPVPIYDGWLLLGFLSFVILTFKKVGTSANLVIFAITSHILFFVIFGGENYPWYQFIIFPLLALASGIVIENFIKKPQLIFNIVFFLITFSSLLHYSRFKLLFVSYLESYRFLVAVFVVLPILLYLFKFKYNRLLSGSLVVMLLLSLWLGTRIINNMQSLYPYLEGIRYPLFQAYCCSSMP